MDNSKIIHSNGEKAATKLNQVGQSHHRTPTPHLRTASSTKNRYIVPNPPSRVAMMLTSTANFASRRR